MTPSKDVARTAAAFEYAPAPESTSIATIRPKVGLFIDGDFRDGSGAGFKTINPATEEVLSEVAEATEVDLDRAVKSARAAQRKWSRLTGDRKSVV